MAIDWDTIYKQKWQELSGGYKKREDSLNAAKDAELGQLNAVLNANKSDLASRRDESMREAYISQMNAYKDLPETLKKSGISGGITETAAADILRTYQNSRNSANSLFSDGVVQLNSEYDRNKSQIDSRYLNLFNELEDAKKNDVWEQTKFAYNAAVEEQKRLEEQEKARQAQLAAQAAALEEKRRWEAEQALARAKQEELIRQFNEQMAFKQQQAEWERQQTEIERAQAAAAKSSGGSSRSGSKKKSSKNSGSKSSSAANTSASRFNYDDFFKQAKKMFS